MRQRDVAALDAKYVEGMLADAKAEKMMLCVMMLPLVVVGQYQSSLSVSAWSSLTASGVDNAASPRLADTAERIISPSERGWSLAKTTGRNPEVY